MTRRFCIAGQRLFDGDGWLSDRAVVVEEDTISAIVPLGQVPADVAVEYTADGILAPGFVDLQVNGGGGALLNSEPTAETVNRMAAAHRATGTTAMMPTLISDARERRSAAVDAVREARRAGNRAVLGLHLEGPFLAAARRGTHRADMLAPLRAEDVAWLSDIGDLRIMLTLAPEFAAPEQLRQLAAGGVLLCAGHTDAGYERIRAAAAAGLRGVTHLFNAMSPLRAREPGTIGAALDCDGLWVGLIADGHHVHPANLRIACAAKPADKVCLVTDAMATVGGSDDGFELYGERIELRGGRLVNREGVLAGSAIGMIDAVRSMTEVAGLPLDRSLAMASRNPAAFLGLGHRLGRIAPGFRADLVHFGPDYRVRDTWIAGRHAHHPHRPGSDPRRK